MHRRSENKNQKLQSEKLREKVIKTIILQTSTEANASATFQSIEIPFDWRLRKLSIDFTQGCDGMLAIAVLVRSANNKKVNVLSDLATGNPSIVGNGQTEIIHNFDGIRGQTLEIATVNSDVYVHTAQIIIEIEKRS